MIPVSWVHCRRAPCGSYVAIEISVYYRERQRKGQRAREGINVIERAKAQGKAVGYGKHRREGLK